MDVPFLDICTVRYGIVPYSQHDAKKINGPVLPRPRNGTIRNFTTMIDWPSVRSFIFYYFLFLYAVPFLMQKPVELNVTPKYKYTGYYCTVKLQFMYFKKSLNKRSY